MSAALRQQLAELRPEIAHAREQYAELERFEADGVPVKDEDREVVQELRRAYELSLDLAKVAERAAESADTDLLPAEPTSLGWLVRWVLIAALFVTAACAVSVAKSARTIATAAEQLKEAPAQH